MLTDMSKVRLRVGEILKEKNMTITDFAELAHIAPGTARMLAKGNTERVDLFTMAKICDALGIKPGDLFVQEED